MSTANKVNSSTSISSASAGVLDHPFITENPTEFDDKDIPTEAIITVQNLSYRGKLLGNNIEFVDSKALSLSRIASDPRWAGFYRSRVKIFNNDSRFAAQCMYCGVVFEARPNRMANHFLSEKANKCPSAPKEFLESYRKQFNELQSEFRTSSMKRKLTDSNGHDIKNSAVIFGQIEHIKISFEDEVRRVPSNNIDKAKVITYDFVVELAQQIFSNLAGKNIQLQWKDDDDDMITIASEDELKEALSVMSPKLKFFIKLK